MSRPSATGLRFAAAGLAILVLASLVALVHPVLLTGRSYELTVRDVKYGPMGHVSIAFEDVLTHGTQVTWSYSVSPADSARVTYDWNGSPRGFLLWPRKEHDRGFGFWASTEDERAGGQRESPAVRDRLLIQKGTYRIRSGERLTYYRRQDPDGTVDEWHIEVRPSP